MNVLRCSVAASSIAALLAATGPAKASDRGLIGGLAGGLLGGVIAGAIAAQARPPVVVYRQVRPVYVRARAPVQPRVARPAPAAVGSGAQIMNASTIDTSVDPFAKNRASSTMTPIPVGQK